MEVNILPILLERKSLILQRLSALQPQEQLSDLRAAGRQVLSTTRSFEIFLIDNIDKSGEKAKVDAEKLMEEAETTLAQRERMMKLEVELQERRSAIWLSFLQRESVASIIGALLLLALGIALIVAMFIHTAPTDVVMNAFLLILGYFFGQATSRQRLRHQGYGTIYPKHEQCLDPPIFKRVRREAVARANTLRSSMVARAAMHITRAFDSPFRPARGRIVGVLCPDAHLGEQNVA